VEKEISHTKSLTKFINNINDTTDTANENEPNFEGTAKVKRGVYSTISSHKEMDWERKFLTRQSNLYMPSSRIKLIISRNMSQSGSSFNE
jgi:hypothetical protein